MKKISLIILSILVLSSCGKKSNSISGPTRTDFGKYIDKCIEKNVTDEFADGWYEITSYYESFTESRKMYQYSFIGNLQFLDGKPYSNIFFLQIKDGRYNFDIWYNNHTYYIERYTYFLIYDDFNRTYGGTVDEDPMILTGYFSYVYSWAQYIHKNSSPNEEYKYTFKDELFTGSSYNRLYGKVILEDDLFEYNNYELIGRRTSKMIICNDDAVFDDGYIHFYTDERKTNPIEINVKEEYMYNVNDLIPEGFDPSKISLYEL
ncbi:MAG: hypothetical protein MR674_01325 [Erysipelotrichaceae bacterium]|nr:hypothetical protein [Erysipelotrichaceae bacterium]